MKIAYMMGSLNRGGAEVLMLDVFRNTTSIGLNIIGIHRKGGTLQQDFEKTGIPLFQIRPRNHFDIIYLFRLRRLLINNKIDIVHAQSPLDAFFSLIACFCLSMHVVVTFHGHSNSKSLWYKFVLWNIFRYCKKYYFVSVSQKNDYANRFKMMLPEKAKVIYNCIDLKKLKANTLTSIREEIGINKNELLLGCVGNFNFARDQYTICKALKVLKEKNINFNFIFIGARQDHSKHLYDRCVEFCNRNNLNKQVKFLGARNDIPSILKSVDAFVYASIKDTFGIAVIEAMMQDIPVIVNDWKVMLEITENGKWGEVYKTGECGELAHKIIDFINNKQKIFKRAEKAGEIVRSRYNVASYLKVLHLEYNSILQLAGKNLEKQDQ